MPIAASATRSHRAYPRCAGIQVLAAARRREDAESAAAAIGNGVHGVGLDLAVPAAAAREVVAIEARHGPIDILVNNAAVMLRGDALGVPFDDVVQSLAVNALAPLALIQALGPGMRERRLRSHRQRVVGLGFVLRGHGRADRLCGEQGGAQRRYRLQRTRHSVRASRSTRCVPAGCAHAWAATKHERTPQEGADTPIWLATLPDDGPTGGFFRDRQPIPW